MVKNEGSELKDAHSHWGREAGANAAKEEHGPRGVELYADTHVSESPTRRLARSPATAKEVAASEERRSFASRAATEEGETSTRLAKPDRART